MRWVREPIKRLCVYMAQWNWNIAETDRPQVDGDRGKWLYRGYLVGNGHADLAGRWRDTLSPTGVPGYEGCFLMERRR